jgi:RNA polymerase-binding transcription factor DksA
LYFLDSEEALNIRNELNKECDKNVIIYLQNYFRENNKVAQCYKLMKDVYENQIKICENNGEKIPEKRLLFSLKDDFNEKRYNIQQKENHIQLIN